MIDYSENYVRILGARGSVPVSGRNYIQFGGSTTSFLVKLSGVALIVDAGTGICRIPEDVLIEKKLDLLLTHLHLDHLMGLPLCPFVMKPERELTIDIPESWEPDTENKIRQLFSLPYWPVTLDDLPADILFKRIKKNDYINNLKVETIDGVHPGGVAVYKISNSEKSIVIATDCTLTDSMFDQLEAFAAHCDLLLIDGQYSDREWENKSSYGHSKWSSAAILGRACEAKKVCVVHHDPMHTDEILSAKEKEIKRIYSSCSFAKEDEMILI